MQVSTLKNIGLSEGEAKVYLSLITLGSTFTGELTKKAGINRTNVYDALERLMERGLVSFVIRDGKKYFSPAAPCRLKELLEEKQKLLDAELTSLEKEFNSSKVDDQATVYYGRKGLKSVLEEVLRENKTIYTYGAENRFSTMFPVYQKQWTLKRVEKGIWIKVLFKESVREKNKQSLGLIDLRYLPNEYQFPSTTLMCGEITLIIAWEPLFVFYIRSKDVVKSNMSFFNILWKSAKK
jgi:HTH-type transcriptional regulator, sugar sensing transcriptional regulator